MVQSYFTSDRLMPFHIDLRMTNRRACPLAAPPFGSKRQTRRLLKNSFIHLTPCDQEIEEVLGLDWPSPLKSGQTL